MRGLSFVVALLVLALGISSVADARGRRFFNNNNRNNRAEIKAFNQGFNAGAQAAVSHKRVGVAAFNQHGLYGVNGFQLVRFNTFGTRTVVDAHGNVFEVDAHGNAFLRGNQGGFSQYGGFVGAVVHPFGAAVFVPAKVGANGQIIYRQFGR